MSRITRIILRSKPAKAAIAWLQRKPFPGYPQLNWYAIIEFFMRWIDTRDMHIRASSLAYTFFLALFPSAIFFFTLIAYLPFQDLHNDILSFFSGILPHSTFKAMQSTLEDILKKQHSGLLSLGFLTAVYFSTNGFVSLMKAFNRYGMQTEKRSFWKQRLVAIILAMVVAFSFLISVLMVTIGNFLIAKLVSWSVLPVFLSTFLLVMINYLTVMLIVLTIVSTVYYLAPSHNKESKWRFITPGSVFASLVILLTTLGFSYYVNQFNSYNKVYGSIGVIIVVMLLIYINTYIMLLGYELNRAIDKTILELKEAGSEKTKRVKKLQNFIISEE